jgi:N-acylglucosamine-6-phosphate 2-epimerase
MNDNISKIQGGLVVSCQALENEPLHSSIIMGRMAFAAKQGGASGIRANTVADIEEIKKNVELPIIGIIKRDYSDSQIYITPTIKEVDELMAAAPDVIAVDATDRIRPGNLELDDFYRQIRQKYPEQPLLADCSTIEEAVHADRLGFDFVGTTLVGYTEYSKNLKINENDFEIIRTLVKEIKGKLIAEGNIDTPQKAKRVLELGCYSVVVGGAITRPQQITKKFVDAIECRE